MSATESWSFFVVKASTTVSNPMSEQFQIDGLSEILAKLDALPEIVKNGAVRGAIEAGCAVIADRARELCPTAPPNSRNAQRYGAVMGSLKASIKVLPVTFKQGWANGQVSAGSKVAYYARWVEFGTAAHLIKAGQGKLPFDGTYRATVHHPGAAKHPFMRPALDSARDAAIDAFADYCRHRIEVENILAA
jgi:HK97 gp10 family phage protein